MKLDLSPIEADFLAAQLRRHIEQVESELARTDKHQLQHALACDVDALRAILHRLTQTTRS
jgi:chromosomal replication initiation ATPase DnaA